jgi:photosystem II stability/assembly factor-like uncharacterized protein
MRSSYKWPLLAFALATTSAIGPIADAAEQPTPLTPIAAAKSPIATQAPMLAAAWAGQRAVSVGANGVVLLSDDRGRSYRQAQKVPVSSTLTGVSFVDARLGWAVGHWGAILATEDGGETWRVQRLATDEDRPLFAVHFFDANHGVAVGLWSLVLVTKDGGKTWSSQQVSPKAGTKSDLNLLNLFADGKGGVFAPAEKGQLLYSADRGNTWAYWDTGYKGSLWCGAALDNGTLLVGGQRGTLLRSGDGGRSWERVPLDSTSSVAAIVANGLDVMVVGLDGLQARSVDGGRTFARMSPSSAESFTAVLAAHDGAWLTFSRRGVVHAAK